jgi:ABC-type transporter Mla subunit MlaD
MGLLDDAKAFAEQAQRALDQAVEQVNERIDEFNRRRRFNELARQLGMLVYRARDAQQDPDPAEVTRLCAELAALEAELNAPRARPGQGERPGATPPPDDPAAPPQAQAGRRDYTLDDLEE